MVVAETRVGRRHGGRGGRDRVRTSRPGPGKRPDCPRGYADGTFGATVPLTRQAMAAFMFRLGAEEGYQAPATPQFPDVRPGHPFFTEIQWMGDTGLSTGYDDGTFRTGGVLTRQAMAAFLYRYDSTTEP